MSDAAFWRAFLWPRGTRHKFVTPRWPHAPRWCWLCHLGADEWVHQP